jgi:hypothetical protein
MVQATPDGAVDGIAQRHKVVCPERGPEFWHQLNQLKGELRCRLNRVCDATFVEQSEARQIIGGL